jgi:YidC/Oxa1 family membrane protein insertase
MIPLLQFFYAQTHSYGFSIILLTCAVRLVVWPLVSKQTKSMQKMQLLQPKMKELQERYKSDPEQLQKKMMEFYAKNKMNPLGGCLPLLIQFPILIALFSTFNGPPFGDKPIDVKVKVSDAKDLKVEKKETSGGNSAYVSRDGKVAKVIVFPGDATVGIGEKIDFATRATEGSLGDDFKVRWELKQDNKVVTDATVASIDETGHAVFNKTGEYMVQGVVHGIAKQDTFFFINSLGKTATGLDLLKPTNFDMLGLILAFGASMFLSSKLSMGKNKVKPEEMDESQAAQAQMMKIMPLTMTGMFFFFPLPTGVYLYMVVSNLFQTVQTWLVMQNPPAPLVDPDADLDIPSGSGGSGKVIDVTPKASKNGSNKESGATISIGQSGEGARETVDSRKTKKKKK